MVERPKGTESKLPLINESAGLRRSYLASLRRFLVGASNAIRDIIIPSYRQRILTIDTDENDFRNFENILAGLVRSVNETVRNLLNIESARHTSSFISSVRSTFGVDIRGIVSNEDLEDFLEAAALRNAGLIKGLSDDLVRRVRFSTTNALINGSTVAELRRTLRDDLGFSDTRAQLIASDQTAKLNADLNKRRHQQAGIEDYIWVTSRDERVRERHRKINGRRFTYGEETPAENGAEPGQPIRCRCIAQAVVVF